MLPADAWDAETFPREKVLLTTTLAGVVMDCGLEHPAHESL